MSSTWMGIFLFLFDNNNTMDTPPQAAKSSSDGDIYVVDMGNDRLLHFNSEGELKRRLGKKGKQVGGV